MAKKSNKKVEKCEAVEYKAPKPSIDKKKYEAIKTLQSDPYFKDRLYGVSDLIAGYEAGLKAAKKGNK